MLIAQLTYKVKTKVVVELNEPTGFRLLQLTIKEVGLLRYIGSVARCVCANTGHVSTRHLAAACYYRGRGLYLGVIHYPAVQIGC